MPTTESKKKKATAPEPTASPTVQSTSPVKQATKADKLWDQIKDLSVEMYALPNQLVSHHVERLKVADDKVHLRVKSPAIVPALEEAVAKLKLNPGERFDISCQTNFIVVSIVFDPDTLVK